MMTLKALASCACLCLCLSSCGEDVGIDPAANARSGTFVWETQERPYQVVAIGGSNVPRIGDQARTAQAVYENPDSQADVEKALREIYGALKDDIAQTQPDAKYRRIVISVYDTEGDLAWDPRAWLCSLIFSPEPGEPFPDDPGEFVEWQWRDPEGRPPEHQRRIEWAYLEDLEAANVSVQFPLTDGELPGLDAAERRKAYEERYSLAVEESRERLAAEHDMTEAELQSLLDRILAWKYANEVMPSTAPEQETHSVSSGAAQTDAD